MNNDEVTPHEAARLVEDLWAQVSRGEALEVIPLTIKRIIQTRAWARRLQQGREVRSESFAKFVTAYPLEGCGWPLDKVRALLRDDAEARVLFEQALQEDSRPGGDRQSEKAKSIVNIVNNGRPMGNTEAYALRRLTKDRPDLLQRVIAGDLSANAAMIEAGFRRRMLAVPDDLDALIDKAVERFGLKAVEAAVKQRAKN